MAIDYFMCIGGEQVESATRARFSSTNPFTGEVWASLPTAGKDDVDRAIAAARGAFETTWETTSGLERARLMHALADALDERAGAFGRLETIDNGKIIRETESQMHFMARNLRFFAGYADKLYGRTIPMDASGSFDYTTRLPYGVAALITAWNSPMGLLSNKLAPALATGNVVVIKPSEHASVTTCELATLATEVGFPPGVINVITGDYVVGDLLTSHPGIDKISFTGGTATGMRIAENAAKNLVPVTLELGGKSANVIFDDADLKKAIPGAVAGIFAAGGQTCIAGSRLLVQRGVYAEVLEAIAARASAIRLGDPLDPATEMGPVANSRQYERILSLIDAAKSDGAHLATGGHAVDDPALQHGYFVAPTVFKDVSPDMTIAREEVFGPVLSVIAFGDEREAIEIANGTQYGLASGLWTENLSRAQRVSRELRSGVVWINTYRASAAQAPFGGIKHSGYGRERGEEALAEYTWVKNVMLDFSDAARDPFVMKN